MQDGVAVGAEREEIAPVMLAAGASDQVVNLHASAAVALWPPADGAGAVFGGEVGKELSVSL